MKISKNVTWNLERAVLEMYLIQLSSSDVIQKHVFIFHDYTLHCYFITVDIVT